MRIEYSDQYNSDTSAEKLLTIDDKEVWDGANTNYWILPNYSTGIFILNLGCKQKFSGIRLVNTHNAEHKTRATKKFRNTIPVTCYFKYNVFIFRVYVSLTESGPWTEALEAELEDSRQQEDPLSLQLISLESEVLAQFVKFEASECWGKGCGLQYFDVQRSSQ